MLRAEGTAMKNTVSMGWTCGKEMSGFQFLLNYMALMKLKVLCSLVVSLSPSSSQLLENQINSLSL